VELVIALLVLYGAQCVALLPYGATLFARPVRSWWVSTGPGWRMLHPIPSSPTLIAARFPLLERDGGLRSRGVATWLSRLDWGERQPELELGSIDRVEARGALIRVNRRAFARGVCRAHAESLAGLLRDLAKLSPDEVRSRIERELAQSLSLEGYTAERSRFQRETRWLAWTSNLYFVWILVPLPVLTWWLGAEGALRTVLPIFLILHLATLLCFARAHRVLVPRGGGALFEALLTCVLYPPLLLRGLHELRTAALARFHPAVVAATVLPKDHQRSFLRAELLRAASASGEGNEGVGIAELERSALLALARELGESEETLFAPPHRQDPLAQSYCPGCLTEYRRAEGRCTDCETPLVRCAD
jgi:hypothetical protein